MKEADVRREVFRMLRKDLGLWPITQTDLNAPYDIAAVKKLMGALIRMTERWPKIRRTVFALQGVLDKAVARPPKGRPDILVLNPTGISAVVEVKALNLLRQKSFSFDNITPEQVKWLDRWLKDEGLGYIALGTVGVKPRRLWLIDWWYWTNVQGQVEDIQNSLPYIAGKGFNKEMQEGGFDMDRLLSNYELERKTGGWILPPDHTLLTLMKGDHGQD